tara:strand:+ start:772 stop:2310 length:1539 start_codon:yes stop_codon:yes gene_type:complete
MHSIISYDFIIIGGGIAGLYAAYSLKKKNKNYKILVLEKKNRLGGRIKTINEVDKTIFESGAARISERHINVLKLLKELNLKQKLLKLPPYPVKKENKNKIFDIINKSKKKSKEFRLKNTFESASEYFNYNSKQIINDNGYNTNMEKLNLEDYLRYHKNISNIKNNFYKLKNGLTQICLSLEKHIGEKNIIKNCALIDFEYNNNTFEIHTHQNKITTIYYSKYLFLAIPKTPLLEIPALKTIRQLPSKLRSVHETNYIRIFAKYPVDKKNNWIIDIPIRTTTPSIARQIIIADRDKNLIEIYCDGVDAKKWHQLIIKDKLYESFQKYLSNTFPKINFPKPQFVLPYYWKAGSHFWKKNVDSNKIKNSILNPVKNLFIVGEAYSDTQAWMEGCLQSVNKGVDLLEKQLPQKSLAYKIPSKKRTLRKSSTTFPRSKKKVTCYSIDEVAKHNTPDNAWVAYDNNVYDITDWISRHPGGNVILYGIGKDITQMFNAVGHSKFALKKLKEYQIGNLK